MIGLGCLVEFVLGKVEVVNQGQYVIGVRIYGDQGVRDFGNLMQFEGVWCNNVFLYIDYVVWCEYIRYCFGGLVIDLCLFYGF